MPMIDLVFKNYTSQKALGKEFFIKVFEVSARALKLNQKLELSVNLVGETKIKELNKKYRRKNKSTDVLSFPLGDGSGDVFICLSIAKNDAKRENITIKEKLAQLTVHGFLHLNGYSHEQSREEANKMFMLERKISDKLNY